MALLSVEGITRRFGGIVALDDVSLSVDKGEIAGLIGPNGAGKTTAFNVITRLYEPDAGRVVFDGTDLLAVPPYKVVRHGVPGSGAWTRYRSIGSPSSATRLASQSARIAFARPSGIQPPPSRRIPPFVTIRAPSAAPDARSACARSRSLWPSSSAPSPYEWAVSKTVKPACAAAATVSVARPSSRSSSVERRMQPRPMRGSVASSQGGRLRRRSLRKTQTIEWLRDRTDCD